MRKSYNTLILVVIKLEQILNCNHKKKHCDCYEELLKTSPTMKKTVLLTVDETNCGSVRFNCFINGLRRRLILLRLFELKFGSFGLFSFGWYIWTCFVFLIQYGEKNQSYKEEISESFPLRLWDKDELIITLFFCKKFSLVSKIEF